jgi:hypothetical protein
MSILVHISVVKRMCPFIFLEPRYQSEVVCLGNIINCMQWKGSPARVKSSSTSGWLIHSFTFLRELIREVEEKVKEILIDTH